MFNKNLWREARQQKGLLFLAIALSFLGGLAVIAQAFLLSRVVDQLFLQQATATALTLLLRMLLVVILLRAGALYGREVAANQIAAAIKQGLRQRLFAHLQSRGPVRTAAERTGELTAVLTSGVDALEAYFSAYLPQLFVAFLIPVSILVAIFPVHWLSALILLLTAPLLPFFMILIGRYAETLTRKQWWLLSRMSAHFLDVLQGLTTLKVLGQSDRQRENVARIAGQFRERTLSVLRVAFLSALVLELIATLSVAIVAVAIGLRLLQGGIPFADALFILILAPEFYLPLRQLGQRFHAGMDGTAAAERIFALLGAEEQYTVNGDRYSVNGNRYSEGSRKSGNFVGPCAIEFGDVHVAFADGRSALRGVSFTINPGETVALVGPSGAGKSTIAHLLLGFLTPTAGHITIYPSSISGNRAPISDPTLLDQITWVPQRPYLFHDTIAANIRLGRPEATLAEVQAAAERAQLHTFVRSLPARYETIIGERGTRLSGGQAQRLALARAWLTDSPFLVLDEPTANLDPATEAALLATTAELLQGRTVLLIAHRLHTVVAADKIIVLDEGQIVETGVHADLLRKNGRYAKLLREEGWHAVEDVPLTAVKTTPEKWIATAPREPAPVPNSHMPIRNLLSFLRPYGTRVALAVLLGTLTIGSSIGLMGAAAYLVSAAALQPSIAALSIAIVSVRFFGLSRGVLRYLERLISHQITFRLLAQLRVWFYDAVEPLAPAVLLQSRSGDLLHRVVADVETLQEFYSRVVGPPLVAGAVTLGMTLFLWRYDPRLAFTLLLFILVAGVALPLLVRWRSRRAQQELIAASSRLQVLLVDGLQGMADLQAFRSSDRMVGEVGREAAVLAHVQRRLAWLQGLYAGAGELLAQLAGWSVLWLALPLVSKGQIDGVYLAGLVLTTLAAFEAVQPLPMAAQQLAASRIAARRLFATVNVPPAVHQPEQPAELPPPDPANPPSLAINGLRFAYPAGKDLSDEPGAAPQPGEPADYVIDNLTLELPPGRKIAIVGPSGAGKSTLLHLLLRFWEYEGSILLGGRELHESDPEASRRYFSVITQHTHLFNASIRDNLRLARPEATQQELETAARAAQIHGFITTLPQGYETQVGEQGMALSGGERQRLAIARALLRDAPILLLDEPTANLDAVAARRVLHTIFQTCGERSLILITHRRIGLDLVDEVLVMEGSFV